jgi:predicted DCC family thiol-disulfide oxidoreductase YuxK
MQHRSYLLLCVSEKLTSGDASQPASEPASQVDAGILYYDGDCPFCRSYVRYLRVKDAVGVLHLVNIRDQKFHQNEVLRNFDFNEGMLLELGGAYYHGSACIHVLALLSSRSTLFNRINAFVFRSQKRAQWIYPILRAGRNAALWALGRGKISRH